MVVLDVMLPGADGFDICRKIPGTPDLAMIPVLMLTAKGEDVDRIVGPRSGTGLGLTFARRVADVRGGTIGIQPASVQNGHAQGCRVVITLPRQGPLVNGPDL
jgi:CheY-like chemotaxis protein